MQHDLIEGAGSSVPESEIKLGGFYLAQIIRDGKVIDEFECHNLVVNEGLNRTLNVMFNGATQSTTWYLGLFEGNYTPVATLTAATVASAATECTAYSSSTRPEYVEATSSAQSTTNSANRASFIFTSAKSIYGAFLISDNTKGGTSGYLFSAARFSAVKNVDVNDELLLTYTFNASSV
jgi:hypothetical protein